jgi:non-heme chloroperoxidase
MTTRSEPMLVATPDGPTVVVHEWGRADGPEILLIHGVAQSHLCFARQLASALAQHCRIIAYDVRGHGGSDKPLSIDHYTDGKRWADEVQAVIAAKALHRPVLVGWSLGGRIIGQYLVHHGDARLGGINFVAARVVADAKFSGPALATIPAAAPRDLASHIAMASAFLRACYHVPPSESEFADALAYNMLTPLEVREAIRVWPAEIPATLAALRAARVPTLVTHGLRDAVVLPTVAELVAATVPGARTSLYAECGHAPFWEEAARFNRELLAFVTEVASVS